MAEDIEREAVLVGIENEYKNVEKIKTPFAKIIVEGTVEKPYYSILWLDKENKEYNVGYSSYCLDYVFKWMEVVFEIVSADEPLTAEGAPVRPGRWISLTECANEGVYCSICKKKVWKSDYAWCSKRSRNKLRSNYCPNCGAAMDLEE